MRLIFFLLVACNLACAPKGVEQPTPKSMPILPSFKAQIYTLAPSIPRDPFVRELLQELPYDEALAGAASALALALGQGEAIDSADVNWACMRSGWPYPLTGHRQLILPKDSDPSALIDDLQTRPESRLGVVRARSSESDIWVLLQSDVSRPMAPLEMSHALQETLSLPGPTAEGLIWRLVDPEGHKQILTDDPTLDQRGEWLIEAKQAETLLYRAALYVDMAIPELPLIQFEEPAQEPATQKEQAHRMINEAHQLFFTQDRQLTREPSLDSSASIALRASLNGNAISNAELRFEQLGFTQSPRNEVGCLGETVRTCLDELIWAAETRGLLLAREHDTLGVAVENLENGGLALMLNLAAD